MLMKKLSERGLNNLIKTLECIGDDKLLIKLIIICLLELKQLRAEKRQRAANADK